MPQQIHSLPGPFTVLQGTKGDGLSNTIDSMPPTPLSLRSPYSTGREDESNCEADDIRSPTTAETATPTKEARNDSCISNIIHHTIIEFTEDEDEEGYHHVEIHSAAATTPSRGAGRRSTETTEYQQLSAIITTPPKRPSNIHFDDSIEQWKTECRQRETNDFLDLLKNQQKKFPKMLQQRSDGDLSTMDSIAWWQRNGQLAVFQSPNIHEEDNAVLGTLPPGTVVWGIEYIAVAQEDDEEEDFVFLHIESPIKGFVLYSMRSYSYLAPGTPLDYVQPNAWVWRISCLDGAFVREGLELSSRHITTLPYGMFVTICQKTVNSMGLSRLRVEIQESINNSAHHEEPSIVRRRRTGPNSCSPLQSNSDSSPQQVLLSTEPLESIMQQINSIHLSSSSSQHQDDTMNSNAAILGGWISESLNPLSGQRGFVAQPVSFPVPALYRVSFIEGAVIRSDIELSSMQIGTAPYGSILKIVGRAFSEHPMDQCIDRLKLAGGAGWVSVRLNKPQPHNILIVELVGLDEEFDVANPGVYHLKALEEATHNFYTGSGDAIESTPDRIVLQEEPSTATDTQDKNKMAVVLSAPSDNTTEQKQVLMKRSVRRNDRRRHYSTKEVNEEKCLICLTEERSSTIVHGGTGHIACCLTCARILKARGDRCPVCRLPIDSVIQQFWA